MSEPLTRLGVPTRAIATRGNLFNATFDWRHIPTARALDRARRPGINDLLGIMGPFGSGKSSGCSWALMNRARGQVFGPDGMARTRWGVVRNTYRQLEDTTIPTFMRWFPEAFCGRFNKSRHRYHITCFPGFDIEILFRALDRPDHVSNLLSLELTGAWVNEFREIPWVLIDALLLRTNRYPPREWGGATFPGIIADTNPPDDLSESYKKFEKERPPNIRLFRQPPGLRVKARRDGTYQVLGINPKAENLANLAPDYYTAGALGKSTEFIKVFLLGEYGFAQDGKSVYPEYSDHLNYDQDLVAVPKVTILRGWDFGLTPAVVFHQYLPAPRLLVIDELCATYMGLERFADEVQAYSAATYPGYKFEDIADPAGQDPAQTDERSCFEIMRAKGFHPRPGQQSPRLRQESVRYGLRMTTMGMAAIILGPKALILRRGFQGGYHFRRLKLSVEKYAPKPEKNQYSHPHDAHQYVCADIFGRIVLQQMPEIAETPIVQTVPDFMRE